MKTRTLKVLGLVCLLVQANPLAAQQAARLELAEQFSEYFNDQVNSANVTGAAFAVASPDGIVWIGTEGFTDTSRKQPIDENTTFRVASVSKTSRRAWRVYWSTRAPFAGTTRSLIMYRRSN